MAKYRPKHYLSYIYGTVNKVWVDCNPQSRWELIKESDGKIRLANKHTTICLRPDDFERNWVKVKEKINESND